MTPFSANRSMVQTLTSLLVLATGVSVLHAQTPVRPMLEIDEAIFESYEGGASPTQKVLPFAAQRGVGLDGSLRSQAPFGWAVNANPFSHEWNNNARFRDDIMLDTGRYSPTEIDLALPAPGFRWTVGRTYSIPENGGTFEGYQGHNWQQFSQPELVYVAKAGTIEDIIYIVYGADRFLEFRELTDGSDVFRGVNGAAGAIVRETIDGGIDDPDHDVFVYWDRNGTRSYFFDDADSANSPAGGQLWKIIDAAGNAAYVGGQSAQAGVAGYDSNGKMLVAYDTAGRKYDYTYTSGKLTKVEAFVDDGLGVWDEIGAIVEYTYASTDKSGHYNIGNLTEVKITKPLSGFNPATSSPTISYESYYQYDTSGTDQHWLRFVHNAESVRRFKDVLPSESLFNYNSSDIRPYSEIHFDTYFTNSNNPEEFARVRQTFYPGHNTNQETGGGNARVQGRVNFEYYEYTTFSDTSSSYNSEHARYTSVRGYSIDKFLQYFDEAGQPLSRVINPDSSDSIPPMWDFISRDKSAASSGDDDAPLITDGVEGMINVHARPMSIEAGTVNPPDVGSGYITPCTVKANDTGETNGYLVNIFPRITTTTDPYFGFMSSRSWQNGGVPDSTANGDGPHNTISNQYLDDVNRVELVSEYYLYTPLISQEVRYPLLDLGSGQGTGEVIAYTYKFHAEPLTGSSTAAVDDPQWLVPRQITTGLPTVPTSQLGSGVSETEDIYLRADGTTVYFRNAEDVYSYMQIENGLDVRVIEDADLGQSSYQSGEEPSVYMATVPSTTGAMHLITDFDRDEVGRVIEKTLATGRVKQYYYTQLASGELVRVGSSKTAGSTHTGPGSYIAYDHAGNVIVDARFAIEPDDTTNPGQTAIGLSGWVDSTDDIALDSLLVGEFSQVMTYQYDETGRVIYTNREYHTLPTSGLGERFYNYDEDLFGYGYGWRQEVHFEATGTTRFIRYDAYGETDLVEIGSYDPRWEPDSAGGSSVVTIPSSAPLAAAIAAAAQQLKPGQCCDFLTSLYGAEFAQGCFKPGPILTLGTGTQGLSFMQADIQERVVFEYNPVAPHTFREYDNLGRLIAAATYSAVPSQLGLVTQFPDPDDRDAPDIFTDFDSRNEGPADISSNRMALAEYVYNPRGQLYKVITHEIDQSSGASLDTIETIIGYDPVGRAIYSNSGQINKTTYDAIGRVTDRYIISESDDVLTNYSDLQGVEDDVVINEMHYARNNESGNVTLSVSVDRLPSVPLQPEPLGQLDTTDYSDYTSITILQADMKGRPQIVEYEYDSLDRPLERRVHGTGDIENANFVLSSPPSGALVTELEFGPGGRVGTITDSLLREHKRSYNLAGRVTQIIENYVDSGTGLDENRTTEYIYENTQLRTYRAYIDANASPPTYQDTTYTWGEYAINDPNETTLSTGYTKEKVRRIKYPDGDSEYFDFGLHGNMTSFIDRAGNEFRIELDKLYRPKLIDFYNVEAEFLPYSDSLHEIEIAYEDRGLVSSVAQYRSSTLYDQVNFDYDGWGAIESFTQDHEWLEDQASSAVEKSVQYEWGASHATGPSKLRLDSMTNPDGSVLANLFSGATNTALSRVLSMTLDLDGTGTTHSPVTVATYEYLGLDRVSKTTYPENDVYSTLKDASHNYDALDRFNRVTRSRWNRTRASNEVPFYDTTVYWDAGSNITGITDHIFDDQFNFVFENDDLDRMEKSTRGGGTGSGIVGIDEQEDWVLSRIGNWDNHDLDLNGDLDWSDTDEFQGQSTFSDLNEQTKIDYDTDNDSLYDDVSVTRLYDANGNLISDPDKGHVYKWDALGRLAEVRESTDTDVIAEFKYNALGYRIAERFDSTADGKVDSNDTIWTRLIYDVRWRVVATYEVDVSNGPVGSEDQTQRHVHHNAGLRGVGTGSYIDSVVLRDRDSNGDGTLDERHYYCQNFRADVVAIIDDGGFQIEQMRYTPYGVPFSIPFADQKIDGSLNTFDLSEFTTRHSGAYDVRADSNLDGTLNFFDFSPFTTQYGALSSGSYGRGVQSAFGHNRGYAGYWYVPELGLSHVRYRWYDADLGTWISKDQSGYVDGPSLFEYVRNGPVIHSDSTGLDVGSGWGGGEDWGTGRPYGGDTFDGAAFQKEVDEAIDSEIYATTEKYGVGAGTVHGVALELPNQLIVEPFTGLTTGDPGAVVDAVLSFLKVKALADGLGRCVKFFKKDCFVEGTLVATSDGDKAIEDIEVGQIVESSPDTVAPYKEHGWNLASGQTDLADPDQWVNIDSNEWSLVEMRVVFEDGLVREISALRPDAWIGSIRTGDHLGYFSEQTESVIGDVEILSISTCPELPVDTTGIVRATYKTIGVSVFDLWVSGSNAPIGVTPSHAIYSVSREAWVQVQDLELGERLRVVGGDEVVVESIRLRDGLHTVYNFEVHGNHTYFVGELGVWVHNGLGEDERTDGSGHNNNNISPAVDEDAFGTPNQGSIDSVSRRQTQLRRDLGTGNLDPDSSIPDQTQGKNLKGSHSSNHTPHPEGQRNVGAQEEHSRVAKGQGGRGVKVCP